MGKALGIMALFMVIGFVINVLIGFATGVGLRGFGGPGRVGAAPNLGLALMANLIQIVVGFLLLSGLLTSMLPTRFGRACAVAALFYVIALVIGVVVVIALVAVGVGVGAAGGFR
jgi:hypothetical protein